MPNNQKISESAVHMVTFLSVFEKQKYYTPEQLRILLKLPEGYRQSSRLRTLVKNGRLRASDKKSKGCFSYQITKKGIDYVKRNKDKLQVIGEYDFLEKREYANDNNQTADMFAIDSLGLSALTDVVKETEAMISTMRSIHSLIERVLAIDEESEC